MMGKALTLFAGAGIGAAASFLMYKVAAAQLRFMPVSDVWVTHRDSKVYSIKDFVRPQDVVDLYQSYRGPDEVSTTLNLYQLVCHEITYQKDPLPEYWRFPLETWNLRAGDCEDSSYLLTSLLENAFPSYAVIGLFDGVWSHCWVVVRFRGYNYILESTLDELPANPWVTEQELAGVYDPYLYFNSHSILARPGYEDFLQLAEPLRTPREAIRAQWTPI